MDKAAHKDAPGASADAAYRYRKFTTRLLFRDLRFRRGSARVGDHIPTFELFTTEGDRSTIEDLAGGRPVLLIFGSLTCPMTASAVPTLKALYREFAERVEFVMLNVREAHPGEHLPQPETVEEKLDHARALAHFYAMPWTVVSDDIDGHLHRSLDPKPNSAFLIDADGVIVFRSLWASDRRGLNQALESVANGEKPVKPESSALVVPVARAMGHVQGVMERAGPQAVGDLWWSAFPMALAGRLATVFPALSPDQRGICAALTLALSFLVIVAGIGMWALR
ncbi:MAG: deiodinase-like protein [Pseudomonadota bacterium]|nr:deiodinase-like protein [Pseudomonadota bacterium]